MSVATANEVLERYGLECLSHEEQRKVADALQANLTVEYPNDEWPQWLCDLIDERLAEPYDPKDCMTLEEFRARLHAQRT